MKNINLGKDEINSKNIILIITSICTLFLGISFFISDSIKFLDGPEIFYIVMLIYSGLEFSNYLLTRKVAGMNSLYISLACVIASVSGLKYINDPSNLVLSITLIGWMVIMIIIKLIRIEELRNKNNFSVFINLFCLSLFILLGFLVNTNLYLSISNECMILGFFFVANGILNLVENISNIKFNN